MRKTHRRSSGQMQSSIQKNSPFHANDLFLYEPVSKKERFKWKLLKQNVLCDKLFFTCNIFEKSYLSSLTQI